MPTQEQIREYDKRNTYKNPYPTTDIIIEYKTQHKDGIVLISRKNPPYGLAIPGGFAEWGLSLEENAVKEAKEETNLDVILENPEHPLCVKSKPTRDPRSHIISITYIAKGQGILRAGDDAKSAWHCSIDEVVALIGQNKLVFDHADILKEYFKFRGYET